MDLGKRFLLQFGNVEGVFHGIDEFFVVNASVGSSVVFGQFLDVVHVQKGLFLHAE